MKLKKLIKNAEAKALPFTVMFLMIAVTFSAMFVVYQDDVTVSAASTTQFSKYKAITLNSSQVPSTLTNFPVCINLSSDAGLASDALDSGNDIAFFNGTSAGATQYNHEIELFNGTTGQLVAWVNVTSLAHDADTTIYMYYGDADIGSSAENVAGTWDSNYMLVLHMDGADAASVDDSTANSNDVAFDYGTPDYEQVGRVGYAINFNSSDGECLEIPSSESLNLDGSENISVFFYGDVGETDTVYYSFIGKWNISSDQRGWWYGGKNESAYGHHQVKFYATEDGGTGLSTELAYNISENVIRTWICLESSLNASGPSGETYKDGARQTTYFQQDNGNAIYDNNVNATIAAIFDSGGTFRHTSGTFDEIRVSNIYRSGAWKTTSYNTINNATDGGFFTLGAEQSNEDTCSITVDGLDASDRITFGTGTVESTLWSNATGNWGAGAMMELNITVNTSHTINEVCLSLEDTDLDTDKIHWENVSFNLAVDNASWSDSGIHNLGIYGSSNYTINMTTWDDDWGINPFSGASELSNDTWYVRWKLDVPATADTGTFSTDAWKVYYKWSTEI